MGDGIEVPHTSELRWQLATEGKEPQGFRVAVAAS